VGSNPTPRVSNEGFTANIIRKDRKLATSKKRKITLTYQSPQTTNGLKDYDKTTLGQPIDKITKSLSRPYFNAILKRLVSTNLENAMIICSYILAEQTEINIKNSTKEGQIFKIGIECQYRIGVFTVNRHTTFVEVANRIKPLEFF
jgi:hypothetical protein